MKKLFVILLSCMLLFALTACNKGGVSQEEPSSQADLNEGEANPSDIAQEPNLPTEPEISSESLQPETSGGNAAVVYFSATGNTKAVAETLAELQGADIFEIIPEQPYTNEDLNYNDRASRATVEQNDETARPAISGGIGNIEDYDVIYIGFPIWWGGMPRILYTFFDTYDLSGKTIAPFCTSGSSGISSAVQVISELEPSATVTEGLQANSANKDDSLKEWLRAIGLLEQE